MSDNPIKSSSNPRGKAAPTALKPDPEVSIPHPRRRLTAQYKLRILEEYDRCDASGDKGALLRREGLYTSQITDWRRQRESGALNALNQKRGRKQQCDDKDRKIKQLEAALSRAQADLKKAELVIDIQKKVSQIFGVTLPTDESSDPN